MSCEPHFQRVAIIGMGLIGSSLARAIRERGLAASVVGCARSQATRDKSLELGLAERIELKPLAIRCPSSPAIEFARDDANRLHLLGLGAEAAPDLLAAEGWARTNASLVLPAAGLTSEAEIVVRVLTATPSRERKLLDGRFRVDLLREVRVGDDTAWCCVPLNADE